MEVRALAAPQLSRHSIDLRAFATCSFDGILVYQEMAQHCGRLGLPVRIVSHLTAQANSGQRPHRNRRSDVHIPLRWLEIKEVVIVAW